MISKPQSGTLALKAYAGFFWQLLGFSLNSVLSVVHIVIMARLLTPEIFGQFAVASIIIALTMIVSEFGLSPALVQKTNISDEDTTFVFVSNISLGAALYILLFVFSDSISAVFDNAVSPLIIKVLALSLIAQPIGLASKALLLRSMDFQKIFIATNLSYFIGMLVVGISLALLGYGVWSLVVGLLVTNIVSSIYFLIVSRIKFSSRFNREDSRYLLRYGVGLTSVQVVNQISLVADKLILSQLASNTFLGLYERSQRIQQMPGVFIGGVLDTVLFSTLSKFSNNKRMLGEHFFNFITLGALVGVYLSVSLFTFAELVVLVMLGRDWVEATVVLQLLSALIGFQILSRLSDIYVRATGAFKKSIVVKLVYLLMVFLLAFIGYQFNEINGALSGVVLASAAHTAMMIGVCQRDCGYSASRLWQRIRPGVILSVLLLAKNWCILYLTPTPIWSMIGLVLITDLVVGTFLLRSTDLVGKENKHFIFARLHELKAMLLSKVGRAR